MDFFIRGTEVPVGGMTVCNNCHVNLVTCLCDDPQVSMTASLTASVERRASL